MADTLNLSVQRRYSERFELRADLKVAAGAVTVLFGPSGSGKTSLLRTVAGFDTPNSGAIDLGGIPWFNSERRINVPVSSRRVGFVFQDYALFPHMSATANIRFGLNHLERSERESRARKYLELVGLSDVADSFPNRLSGGQAQRLALARALAPEPALLLLDEPLSALDEAERLRLRYETRRLLVDLKVTSILVTHDRTEALTVGDSLAVMAGGRVLQHGTIPEVLQHPTNDEVARSVGIETVLPCVVKAREHGLLKLDIEGLELVAVDRGMELGNQVHLCLRAEDVLIEVSRPELDSPRNHLNGTIERVIPQGPLVRIEVDCGIRIVSLITRQAAESMKLDAGRRVVAAFKATSVQVLPRFR